MRETQSISEHSDSIASYTNDPVLFPGSASQFPTTALTKNVASEEKPAPHAHGNGLGGGAAGGVPWSPLGVPAGLLV